MTRDTLPLLFHTVRYLRPSQVLQRARLRTRAAVRELNPGAARRRYGRFGARLHLSPAPWNWPSGGSCPAVDSAAASARATDAEAGRFRFLNVDGDLGRPIDWRAPGHSQLWRYKLHYGAYLVDVAGTRTDGWPVVASLMRDWIHGNPLGESRDAWHPFVVAERIVNWMVAIQLTFQQSRDARDILESLAAQCALLERNLEWDVGGNHLLKNLKALAIAGCFSAGADADRMGSKYGTMFAEELSRQLLSDGSHYERSPMYHSLVLEDALEVICAIKARDATIPAALIAAARAMTDYLPHVTHPDGEIALLNDSVFAEAPRPAAMLAFSRSVLDGARDAAQALTLRQALLSAGLERTEPPPSGVLGLEGREDGGIVRLENRARSEVMLVDVGRACPDDLPAHAHADIFSFEMSIDGERLIVDSGVGGYEAGQWREYYRSTRAHNTLAVDNEDQIECWGSFRVARRARITGRAAIAVPLAAGVTASHDGYARLHQPVTIRRTVLHIDDAVWLVVDHLEGSGVHRWDSYLHGAPGTAIAIHDSRAAIASERNTVGVAWFGFDSAVGVSGAEEPRQGWYAPEFGRHLPAPVLVLSARGAVPATCGYVMARGQDALHVQRAKSGLSITAGRVQYRVRFSGTDASVDKHELP